MPKNKKKIIILTILTIILALNFNFNFFGDNNLSYTDFFGNLPEIKFNNFQYDSEFLVLSKIYEDRYEIGNSPYGLMSITTKDSEGKVQRIEGVAEKIKQYDEANKNVEVVNYASSFGLQGHIFTFLYNKLHIPFFGLRLLCCIFLGIILTTMCYFLAKKYNKILGAVFYLTFLLSPWVVAFAKNLYWVEFTWFLPVLFGLILSTNYKKKKIWVPCIGLAIFLKCLCGYEYISAIMLMTISFFIVDFITTKGKSEKIEILKTIFIVGIVCLVAFACAMCIHASIRGGGNIIEGMKIIYESDVLRRTGITGNAHDFEGVYKLSLESSPLETLSRYFAWKTPVVTGIPGGWFNIIIMIMPVLILIYELIRKDKEAPRNLTMLVVYLLTTFSWIVLAKAHSYIHTHINYVLWYFGFVQMALYVDISFIIKIFNKYIKPQIYKNRNYTEK